LRTDKDVHATVVQFQDANHFVVYLLLCEDDWFYVGQTRDYQTRIQQHLSGEGAAFTKRHRPLRWKIVASKLNLVQALAIEKAKTAELRAEGFKVYSL
jgi:predicted GIY-YIG superfamily endonuclease